MTDHYTVVSPAVEDSVAFITGCCPGTVFYSGDGDALILGDDRTWIARVFTHSDDESEAHTEEAYLSTEPIESLVSCVEDTYTSEDLPELQGFTPGFTC